MWDCSVAQVTDNYQEKCQKFECVCVFMCVYGECAAIETQHNCEILYLLLQILKKSCSPQTKYQRKA